MCLKKRIILILLITFLPMTMLSAAGQQETTTADEAVSETRTVTDMKGNEIILPVQGTRYAVLGGPISLTPYLFGVQEDVIAVTKGPQKMRMMQIMDPGIVNKPAPRTTNGNVNVEELLMSDPDCVISFEVDGQIVVDHTDIPVIFLTGSMGDGFEEIKNEVRFFGGVFQNAEKAEEYCSYMDSTLALIDERLKDIKEADFRSVYLGEGLKHLDILGGDTFMNEWLNAAHCKNASFDILTAEGKEGDLHSGFREISMEQVLASDPEIIIINEGKPEDLTQDPRWNEITAVKDGRVFMAPSGLFVWSRPSIESAVLYPLWIAFQVYPEYFADLSLEDEFTKFYNEMFNFNIEPEVVKAVISGAFSSNFNPF